MDQCEFGVDITIPPIFEKSELFSVAKSFPNKRFTWFIQGFSTLPSDYLSEEFIIGGISWWVSQMLITVTKTKCN